MTCPLGKLGSLMTRTTVTSSLVGRGRLITRLTSALSSVDDEVRRIKIASSRKRKAQKIAETLIVMGTVQREKPISEMTKKKRRIQGLRCFCSLAVMALSPGKNSVRRAKKDSRATPASSQR